MNQKLTGAEAQSTLREVVERMRFTYALAEDPKNATAPVRITELAYDKTVAFAWGQVLGVEVDRAAATGSKYARVVLDDGRSFAFAGVGIVFAPVFVSTGPLAECPATACFADYKKLHGHLTHLMADHHEGHEREALQVLMVLLAFLDGARAIGLSVSDEERDLEEKLERLEALGARS